MSYEGDILLQINEETGLFDIGYDSDSYVDITMTDGLETLVILSVFGEKNWQNAITERDSERLISEFPDVVSRGTVSDKTKNDGTEAIKNALAFMITDSVAQKITVTGEILNVFGIGWSIGIERKESDEILKYSILWEKQQLRFET